MLNLFVYVGHLLFFWFLQRWAPRGRPPVTRGQETESTSWSPEPLGRIPRETPGSPVPTISWRLTCVMRPSSWLSLPSVCLTDASSEQTSSMDTTDSEDSPHPAVRQGHRSAGSVSSGLAVVGGSYSSLSPMIIMNNVLLKQVTDFSTKNFFEI